MRHSVIHSGIMPDGFGTLCQLSKSYDTHEIIPTWAHTVPQDLRIIGGL